MKDTGKHLCNYLAKHRRGSFHFVRVLGHRGWECGAWMSLCHLHGSPKCALLATGTMDATSRVVSLDHRDAALHYMMDTSFLAQLFRAAGPDHMPHTIGVSAASTEERGPLSRTSLSIRVPETWAVEHAQREAIILPRPPVQRRPAKSAQAKMMAEGLARLPTGADMRKQKGKGVGVKVRMPVAATPDPLGGGGVEEPSEHTVSGSDVSGRVPVEDEHEFNSDDSDKSLVLPPGPHGGGWLPGVLGSP